MQTGDVLAPNESTSIGIADVIGESISITSGSSESVLNASDFT